jgi:hypothetical protein
MLTSWTEAGDSLLWLFQLGQGHWHTFSLILEATLHGVELLSLQERKLRFSEVTGLMPPLLDKLLWI